MNLSDLEQNTKNDLIQIAKKYTIYYKNKSGQGSITNYESLSREELISAIRNDRDFQKATRELSRIDRLRQATDGVTDAETIMRAVLDIFGGSDSVPTPGNYYTYVYNAKTPELLYDQHPLIACLDVTEWGFRGLNFHLSMQRNYTWNEVGSSICLIEKNEISFFRSLSYKKLLYNR